MDDDRRILGDERGVLRGDDVEVGCGAVAIERHRHILGFFRGLRSRVGLARLVGEPAQGAEVVLNLSSRRGVRSRGSALPLL